MIKYSNPNDQTDELLENSNNLESSTGKNFPIINGIPRFVEYSDYGQEQTSDSFGYKWNKFSDWGIEENTMAASDEHWKDFYGWPNHDELKNLMKGKTVLDAGCGSGSSLVKFIDWPSHIVGVDISTAIDACKNNFPDRNNLQLVQADLFNLPFKDESFDVIWSAGVLHHTPNTFDALKSVYKHLKKGGNILFYIYLKKAPIREYTDDYLRNELANMSKEEAWTSMEKLTRFSKSLSESNAMITLEEDYPELGFKKGEHKLQRFIYYTMMKCYWNPSISFEHNVVVNFDWYHPQYAHRQTPEEVKSWMKILNMKEKHFHVSDAGIFVVGEKV